MSDIKQEMEDINERMLVYINCVKKLKTQNDIVEIELQMQHLESELKSMRSIYESKISSIQSALDIAINEKTQQDLEIQKRKNTEIDLLDKLKVMQSESSNESYQINCLTDDIARRDQEIDSFKLKIQQLNLMSGSSQVDQKRLAMDFDDAKKKLESTEQDLQQSDNRFKSLQQKFDFQETLYNQKIHELQMKLDEYIRKMVGFEARIDEADRKESIMPDLLNRVRKNAQKEYAKLKFDLETFFSSTIQNQKAQLDNNQIEMDKLRTENSKFQKENLGLRKLEAELTSKVSSLTKQTELLERNLVNESQLAADANRALTEQLMQLQTSSLKLAQQTNSSQSQIGSKLRVELANMKAMLDEEEKRLNISKVSGSNHLVQNERISNGYEALHDEIAQKKAIELNTGSVDLANFDLQQKKEENDMMFSEHVEEDHKKNNELTEFKYENEQLKESPIINDELKLQESNLNSIKIQEIGSDGSFLLLVNSSLDKVCDIGHCHLKQTMNGQTLFVYQFPPRPVLVMPECFVKVYSDCEQSSAVQQNPVTIGNNKRVTEFKFEELPNWECSEDYLTSFCDPHGNIIVDFQNHAKHERADIQFSKPFLPELTMPSHNKSELFSLQRNATEPIFNLEGNQKSFVVLQSNTLQNDANKTRFRPVYTNAHYITSKNGKSIHPAMELPRSCSFGNDYSSVNRQTRGGLGFKIIKNNNYDYVQTSQLTLANQKSSLAYRTGSTRIKSSVEVNNNGVVPDPIVGNTMAGTNQQRKLGNSRIIKNYSTILNHCEHRHSKPNSAMAVSSSTSVSAIQPSVLAAHKSNLSHQMLHLTSS